MSRSVGLEPASRGFAKRVMPVRFGGRRWLEACSLIQIGYIQVVSSSYQQTALSSLEVSCGVVLSPREQHEGTRGDNAATMTIVFVYGADTKA